VSDPPGRPQEERSGFERRLGLPATLAVGLGTMIGAGIFVLSADAASAAGPAAAFSFVIAGAVALLIAMNVAELATAMPREGGSYHLISRTLGPMAGAVVGPANWLGLVFAGGFYLIGFGQFAAMLVPVPAWIWAVGVGVLLALLNVLGTGFTGAAQRWIVAALVLALLGFVVLGVPEIQRERLEPLAPEGWGAALGVVGIILVSFTGFEKISTVAEEVRDPERTLPRAILGSVVIATVLYAAVLLVFTGIQPYQEITPEETALINAAGDALGALGRYGLLAAGLLATVSSANAAILASSRICFAMGRDRILPAWLAALHEARGTPHRAILLTAGLAVALSLSGAAARLAEISSSLFIVSYVLITLAVLTMRRAAPEWYDPAFRVPLYPVLPVLAGLAALAVLVTMEWVSLLVGLGLAAAGLPLYLLWGRSRTEVEGVVGAWLRHAQPRATLAGLDMEEGAPREGRSTVLVGVKDEPEGPWLLRLGAAFAAALEADLLALRVEVVSDAVHLERARAHRREEGSPALREVRRIAEEAAAAHEGVRVRAGERMARSLERGLAAAVEENAPILRVLVRGGAGALRIGAAPDSVLRQHGAAPVSVLARAPGAVIRRIVAGVAEGADAEMALHDAATLARALGAALTVVWVVTGDVPEAQEGVRQRIRRVLGEASGDREVRIVRANSVAEGLRAAAGEADLLVVGAGRHPSGDGRAGGTAAELLGEADVPVLAVHASRKGDAERG
jgi:basic amino acid/polyamine antiporter, APA family